jgi:hypothetical protein
MSDYDYDDLDDFNEDEDFYFEDLDELNEMIESGEVKALCPNCFIFISSVYDDICMVCKSKIDSDEMIIEFVDWEQSN